jgi:hypothetical protein
MPIDPYSPFIQVNGSAFLSRSAFSTDSNSCNYYAVGDRTRR